jgi:RNA polymerase sigma-70 factor (family 1)
LKFFHYIRYFPPKMPKYSTLTDQQLAFLLKNDDRDAYNEIYNRFKGILYRHAFSKLQSREEARDQVQELFIMLWTRRNQIESNDNLPGYLYRTLQNRILNIVAHNKLASKYMDSLKDFMNNGQIVTDHLVRESDLKASIEREVSQLPEKMRMVFILSRNMYLSNTEIAEKLNISEKTVRNQLYNALKILRGKFKAVILLNFL